MNEQQAKNLLDAIATAGLVKANGGNWREVFRRRKYRHIGKLHKAYKLLYEYTDEQFEYVLQKGIDAQLDEGLCDQPEDQ